jgi:uncharacterized protein YbaA (DUF1428 family)
VCEDLKLEETLSFQDFVDEKEDGFVVLGWVVFESQTARDLANQRAFKGPRMNKLISPLTNLSRMIIDASGMVYFNHLSNRKAK